MEQYQPIPPFRIIHFPEPSPKTGNKFYIEWKKWVWLYGFIPVKRWLLFKDPAIVASTSAIDSDFGFMTLPEAKMTVDRYKRNMQPVIHNL